MRAVLDTVVFVRALINPKSRWGRLIFGAAGRFTIVVSPEIIREIVEVLYRSSLRERYPEIDNVRVEKVLAVLGAAEVALPNERISVCRDPSGDKFFECAVAGGASLIVSEDKDILAVGEYRGIRTITTEEFAALLQA